MTTFATERLRITEAAREVAARNRARDDADAIGPLPKSPTQGARIALLLPRVRAGRDRADVAAGVAAGVHHRPPRRAGRLLRIPRRSVLGADRARRRRGAAGLPEHLPPPGKCAVRRHWRGPHASSSAATTAGPGTSRESCAGSRPARGFGSLHLSDYPLLPAKVDTWENFVFINMDPDAIPLADYLEEMPADIEWCGTLGFPLHRDGLTIVRRRQLEDDRRRLQRDLPHPGTAPRAAALRR